MRLQVRCELGSKHQDSFKASTTVIFAINHEAQNELNTAELSHAPKPVNRANSRRFQAETWSCYQPGGNLYPWVKP